MVHQDHFKAGGTHGPLQAPRHQVQHAAVLDTYAGIVPWLVASLAPVLTYRRTGASGASPFPPMLLGQRALCTRALRRGTHPPSLRPAAGMCGRREASTYRSSGCRPRRPTGSRMQRLAAMVTRRQTVMLVVSHGLRRRRGPRSRYPRSPSPTSPRTRGPFPHRAVRAPRHQASPLSAGRGQEAPATARMQRTP